MHESLRVGPGFVLASIDPASTPGFDGDRSAGVKALAHGSAEFIELQEKLFAESRFGGKRSVLLVLQAMDTAGKGGILEHVVGQLSPLGVKTFSFKAPTEEEKQHDFLWRVKRQLPPAGYLGVFDRSHYEDVLIHRVRGLSAPEVIEQRYGLVEEFERSLVDSGTTVVKVMLHISPEEQRKRLEARLDDPSKHWKFNPGDLDERELWPAYMEAYEIALNRTSTQLAPWFVVPANEKWYSRLAVQRLLLEELRRLAPEWPAANFDIDVEKRRLAAR